ncbi:hypothetical protein Taro_024194 [Colocasia esculenta]|uniref:Uncharacterized protein n=1 Tax=Colocasia esculenta TaxID=4460 RepID=A0A843VJM8_COLES|nr:hypothetical protein [Colocasia esculenta]
MRSHILHGTQPARVRLLSCQLEHARSLEYSLNRLPRMGVPGNGNNLSWDKPSSAEHWVNDYRDSSGRRDLVMTPYPVTTLSRQPKPMRPGRDAQERHDHVTTDQAVATRLRPL